MLPSVLAVLSMGEKPERVNSATIEMHGGDEAIAVATDVELNGCRLSHDGSN